MLRINSELPPVFMTMHKTLAILEGVAKIRKVKVAIKPMSTGLIESMVLQGAYPKEEEYFGMR